MQPTTGTHAVGRPNQGGLYIIAGGSTVLAVVPVSVPDGSSFYVAGESECIANAHLFAAANKLLAACERVVRAWNEAHPNWATVANECADAIQAATLPAGGAR